MADHPARPNLASDKDLRLRSARLAAPWAVVALEFEYWGGRISMFRAYMVDGAREKLSTVRSALDHLYTQIRATFTVDDLLLKVGDARMRDLD